MLNVDNTLLNSEVSGSISEGSKTTNRFKNKKMDIGWHPKYAKLVEVESYIKEKIKETDLELSYDCTAVENLYFTGLNYTTYAGFLTIHPMCFEQSMRQMADAYADNLKPVGHVDYIKDTILKDKTFSKYNFLTTVENETKEALVVLPGGNKLKKHCCVGKLGYILDRHGKNNVIFKRHPVSYDDIYNELSDHLGGIHFADKNSDLFSLMQSSDFIYSTLISESALIGFILKKEMDHFDLLQNINTTSFGHINHYLFSTSDPLHWASRTFASPKSGIIHPSIDDDWQKKVDMYFDYITELRNFYKYAYVWG